ncbi:SAM-dependent methyltransferase [Actinomadura luteofluorescens]
MADDLPENAPPGIDPSTPTFARVYDYFLGGKDNFAADREVADMVMQLVPEAPVVAQGNRVAIERAVTYMARDLGIDQFVDIGSGLPTSSNVHQFARAANPDARVVYVDNDPIVLAHGRALLTETGVATFIQGDLYEPEKIFTDPALTGLLDLSRPVGVVLAAIIHHVPDDRDPAGVVHALLPFLAPGLGGSYFRHSSEIERFMEGLTILEPGVANVTAWRPAGPAGPLEHPLHSQMVAVLGRKD